MNKMNIYTKDMRMKRFSLFFLLRTKAKG